VLKLFKRDVLGYVLEGNICFLCQEGEEEGDKDECKFWAEI
jgi:hypothetical protein